MYNHWQFIWNVASHLVASMSGLASFCFSLWEHSRQKKLESRVFFIVGVICLAVAFDQAWQDEHRNSEVLKAQKQTLSEEKQSVSDERDFWKQQTYSKDGALQNRDELLVKNYTALTEEQKTANQSQASLAQLSSKILDINKPAVQKITPIFFDKDESKSPSTARFLLLTNKDVSPVAMQINCNGSLESVSLASLGGGPRGSTEPSRLAPNSFEIEISTPAWTPTAPIMATVFYYRTDIVCSFSLK
jgi:hypothetical protein